MLKVEHLHISYPPYSILEQISFTLNNRERIAIVGKSGCGKSTLLEAISGIHNSPRSPCKIQGRIELNGALTTGAKIRFMQQHDLLLEWLKTLDNVALPLRIKGVSRKESQSQARSFLAQFDLEQYAHYYPSQLSGGMRQRIALLRTCIGAESQPLVLLDEPFAKLDMITKSQCRKWASDLLHTLSASCILVTHDIEEAIEFCDSILVIKTRPTPNKNEMIDENIQEHTMRDLGAHVALEIASPPIQDKDYKEKFLHTKEAILEYL